MPDPEPRTFPATAALCLVALTVSLSLGSIWVAWHLHEDSVTLVRTELQIRSLAGRIIQLDEVLTMSARMNAASGDLKWEERYRHFDPELTADIDALIALAPEAFVGDAARATNEANKALVAMENQSFDDVRSGRRDAAMGLLNGTAYDNEKRNYAHGMELISKAIGERAGTMLAAQRLRLTILLGLSIALWVFLIAVWMRIAFLIRHFLRNTNEAERMLSEANADLEQRVQRRTSQLLDANEVLRRETEERLRIEVELQQAQKLEAVGRLASGVAHEINTPVQFVSDSVRFVRDAFADVTALLAKYDAIVGSTSAGSPLAALEGHLARAREEADLQYLLDNVPTALDRSVDGLGRVADIVRSMKEFAHPDQREMRSIDLNQAILSTLTMARSEYKHVADIETDLGELPHVRCHAGEVNQVILNIVINAAHAIGDAVAKTDRKGRITVRTSREGESVVISIGDTGNGIPEDIRDRIFDPFFTTKEVGKGSGQGLAMAHAVVTAKHHGTLTFESRVGRGTTFFVRLPIEGGPQPEAGGPCPPHLAPAPPQLCELS